MGIPTAIRCGVDVINPVVGEQKLLWEQATIRLDHLIDRGIWFDDFHVPRDIATIKFSQKGIAFLRVRKVLNAKVGQCKHQNTVGVVAGQNDQLRGLPTRSNCRATS